MNLTNQAATRSLTFVVTEALYSKLVEKARSQGHTPASYSKLLFEAAWSARQAPTGDKALDAAVAAMDQPKPRDAEGEAIQAMATKGLTRELEAIKAELRRADQRIVELEDKLQATTAKLTNQEIDGTNVLELQDRVADQKDEIDRLSSLHGEAVEKVLAAESERGEARDRAEALLNELEAATATIAKLTAEKDEFERLFSDAVRAADQPATLATPQAGCSVSATLTPDQARRARTYLSYGMSIEDVASTMGCDVKAVQAATGGKAQ